MRQSGIIILVLGCALLLGACAAPTEGGPAPSASLSGQNGKTSAVSQEDAPSGAGESGDADGGEDAYHKITAEEAKAMIDEGGVTVVDVRRPEEYGRGHVPGAVLTPNETIGTEQPEALPDKSAVLIVYCRTGVRSKQASDKLVKMGYEHIYDMGGIVDWPYETESGNPKTEESASPTGY